MDRIAGVEFFKVNPFGPAHTGHQTLVAPDALAWDIGLLFRVVRQSYGVKRCTYHQNPAVGFNNLVKRGALAISVLERMVSGDPLRACANCHPGIRMIAAQSTRPGAHCLMEDSVAACGVGNALVEYGNFEFVGISEEGLKINVGD